MRKPTGERAGWKSRNRQRRMANVGCSRNNTPKKVKSAKRPRMVMARKRRMIESPKAMVTLSTLVCVFVTLRSGFRLSKEQYAEKGKECKKAEDGDGSQEAHG